jgi:hypothetical protein
MSFPNGAAPGQELEAASRDFSSFLHYKKPPPFFFFNSFVMIDTGPRLHANKLTPPPPLVSFGSLHASVQPSHVFAHECALSCEFTSRTLYLSTNRYPQDYKLYRLMASHTSEISGRFNRRLQASAFVWRGEERRGRGLEPTKELPKTRQAMIIQYGQCTVLPWGHDTSKYKHCVNTRAYMHC